MCYWVCTWYAKREKQKYTAFKDDDCSYEKDYSEYTESNSASFVPQDLFCDPSEGEYGYDNSPHITSSNLRAQKPTFEKIIL